MTWIFGYGSLMWNPGFAHVERRPALLRGYHRSYLMYSTRNRGTPEQPGMVLSMAPGGECVGTAFRVEPDAKAEALEYLDRREGVGRANRRVMLPIHWHERTGSTGGTGSTEDPVTTAGAASAAQHAWAFLPILTYSNCIWGVPIERQAELVARGAGKTGTSYDYLRLVLEEVQRMGAQEPYLDRLFAAAGRCTRAGAPPATAAAGL